MTFRIEEDPEYQHILKILERFHKEPIGLTNYLGSSVADNTYPKQLNTIIGLIIRLHQRLDLVNNSISDLDYKLKKIEGKTVTGSSSSTAFNFEQELQNISTKLSKLKVDKGKGIAKKEPQPFGKIK